MAITGRVFPDDSLLELANTAISAHTKNYFIRKYKQMNANKKD
jgi:hypothetical protein